MPFYQYLQTSKIVNISSVDKVDALKELVQIICKSLRMKKKSSIKAIIEEVLKREESSSTFIGQGIAIPYAKAPITDDFEIIVGRNRIGINYDAARNAQVYVIILVLAKDVEEPRHIELRSEIASFFKSEMVREKILSTDENVELSDFVPFPRKTRGETRKKRLRRNASDPVIASAVLLANRLKASALVFLADAVQDNTFLDRIKSNKNRVIIITSYKARFELDDTRFTNLIHAPSFPASRTGQIKIGILLAVSRSLISKTDTVICVSGNSATGTFDTIVALDVDNEFQFFLSPSTRTILPPDIKPEVFERVLGLASEIAIEGREGKPTGTIFVIGDTNAVNAHIRQLIINPFRGYSEAERNILDPALDETIKEFAGIDGAFVITGDGLVLSAGSYLRPSVDENKIGELQSGFGARHAAAAGITACSNALAITVSESTGMVSIFKNGAIMLTLARFVMRPRGTGRPGSNI